MSARERKEQVDVAAKRVEVLLQNRVSDVPHVQHAQATEREQVQGVGVGISPVVGRHALHLTTSAGSSIGSKPEFCGPGV